MVGLGCKRGGHRPPETADPVKIANVITRLNIGGASPIVISLAAGFQDRGHECVLIVGVPQVSEGSMEAEAEKAGIPLVRIPELRRELNIWRDWNTFIKLLRLFKTYRPDIVATHMSKAGALGRLAAWLLRVPVIIHTYHGQGFQVFEQRWKQKASLLLERMFSRMASINITVSEKQQKEFVGFRIGTPAKLKTIRYGLDLQPYLNAPQLFLRLREELGLPDTAILIGVVGRLVAIKGQDVFLHAAARIALDYPLANFVLIGDGESRSAFEEIARDLGLGQKAHFLGWRRDIPAILQNLDIVVLPTTLNFEGVPVAVIEALAAGKPIVATDVGGVSEVIHDEKTGLLVPPRNADALAQALSTLIADPAKAEYLGSEGRKLVSTLYQQERMVDETLCCFKQLLAEARVNGSRSPKDN
jgi:glycosyltransferase involved in cell wall biosynthesis